MRHIDVSSDNLVTWDKMKAASTGAYVNDATVTGVLKDSDDNTVSGSSFSLSYVAASDGKYQGVIESTVSLTIDAVYDLEITAVSGTKNGFRSIPLIAKERGLI